MCNKWIFTLDGVDPSWPSLFFIAVCMALLISCQVLMVDHIISTQRSCFTFAEHAMKMQNSSMRWTRVKDFLNSEIS